MKNLYFLSLAFIFGLASTFAQMTYNYTGTLQTYVVPDGVNHIQFEVWGAEGGGSENCSGAIEEDGGLGGYAVGSLFVTPGQVYNLYVGGKPTTSFGGASTGGYNGGGTSGQYGGPGGGATDVRFGGTGLLNRILVAGGGGGGNTGCPDHGTGGDGGGYTGSNGINLSGGYAVGMGGTAVAGGAGGGSGTAGALGVGGTGDYHVGGGGGGYYGGGGAYAAGGGGGSSYTGGVLDGSTTGGVRTGHGQIIITELCTPLTITVSDFTICLGDLVTIEATSVSGATIIWLDGFTNGVPFEPVTAGFITYEGVSSDGDDCGASVTITVFPEPNIVAHVDEDFICNGDEITLHGTGAASYVWSPAFVIDDEPFTPPLGVSTYIVTGTTGAGCVSADTITIEVFESPTVTGTADDYSICYGESVTFTGSGAISYEWSPGLVEDGVPFSPLTAGATVYTVVGTNGIGCTGSDEVTVTMNEEIVLSYTTVGESVGADGSIDLTVAGGTPGYTFDWNNDGTGDYDDTEDLSGLAGGTYIVVVKDAAGCTNQETIVVSTQLSLDENSNASLAVYPNPTTNFVTITYPGNFVYEVLSIDGKVLVTGSATNASLVNFETFSTGTYLVRLTANDSQELVKVVKN